MPSIIKTILSRRMLVTGLMGFSCGLPILLIISVLQAWMKEVGVDLSVIGLMSLVQLPYSAKFLWSPFLDRYTPPFLGRRRGWMLIAQICLTGAIAAMGLINPEKNFWFMVTTALAISFFSASQDIVVDAYRREDLADEELGLGSSVYAFGYRIGMLLASGGGLILADHMSFGSVYLFMAGCMAVGVITTLLTPEPPPSPGAPKNLREAVIDPFAEYFRRNGALWILAFILLYKIGDQMAATMTTPFYLDIGFTKSEIGAVVKLFGFWATLGGAFLGGVLLLKWGVKKSLWIFGILQAVSTAGFAVLAQIGASIPALAAVIAFENLSGGMGTAAYMGFMAALTNKRFTATQYALLTSFMGLSRYIASAPTGFMVNAVGWFHFFIICALVAAPGLLVLLKFGRWKTTPSPA